MEEKKSPKNEVYSEAERRPPQAAGNSRPEGAEFPSGEARLRGQAERSVQSEEASNWEELKKKLEECQKQKAEY
ncbi:hypothetical protein COS59_01300, partial [Candidatus Wolfebacteria bacterium CG03_land_8_20_14_0_80_36_15]